jgi:hypothetical protein
MAVSIPRDILLTVIGLVVGWGISHFYYAKSIKDMRLDVEERKRVEQLLLRGVESIGTIKYNRDSAGKITGIIIDLKAKIEAQSKTSDVSIVVDNVKK